MILEVARDLDDSAVEFPRCGHSCLDLLRIKRRRLRNACARAQQQREKRRPTAQTRPDDVVGPATGSNLPLVCHGSHALLSPLHTGRRCPPPEGVIDARPPIWTLILEIVNPSGLYLRTICVYASACSTVSRNTVA